MTVTIMIIIYDEKYDDNLIVGVKVHDKSCIARHTCPSSSEAGGHPSQDVNHILSYIIMTNIIQY